MPGKRGRCLALDEIAWHGLWAVLQTKQFGGEPAVGPLSTRCYWGDRAVCDWSGTKNQELVNAAMEVSPMAKGRLSPFPFRLVS
jgi:hypothetical protein